MNEIMFGDLAASGVLTIFLAVLFKTTGNTIPDKWRALVSVAFGIVLGLISIPYNALDWNVVNIVNSVFTGLMIGTAAVGIYEAQRIKTNPRAGKDGTAPK